MRRSLDATRILLGNPIDAPVPLLFRNVLAVCDSLQLLVTVVATCS